MPTVHACTLLVFTLLVFTVLVLTGSVRSGCRGVVVEKVTWVGAKLY